MSSEYDALKSKSTMGNVSLGQPAKIDNHNPPYASPPDTVGKEPASLSDVRNKYAPNADKKTIAAGLKGLLDINSVLKAVDPTGLSSILPGMMSGLSKVNSTMNAAAPSTKKTIIQDSLYNALCRLSRKYTFERVMFVMNLAVINGGMLQIDPAQRSVVTTAITNLVKNAGENGPTEIKIPREFEKVTEIGTTVPTPITNKVPDLYTQVYYTMDTDPYPGYKRYMAKDNITSVYIERVVGEFYYESADDEIYDISVIELETDLDPYMDPLYIDPITLLPVILTGKILDEFLATQSENVGNNGMEKTLGSGSSSNLMDNLDSLMGYTGGIVGGMKSSLSTSVLNQGSMTSSLTDYSKNIAMLKSMKANALTAFKPPAAITSLIPDATALEGVVGNLQAKGLSSATGDLVRSVLNNVKSYI